MHFWFVFDTFIPHTRTGFSPLMLIICTNFSLPLQANVLWVLKVVIKNIQAAPTGSNESVLISEVGLERSKLLLHRFLLAILSGQN